MANETAALWDDADRPDAQAILTRLIETVTAKGWEVNAQFHHDHLALPALAKRGLTFAEVSRTVRKMKAKGRRTLHDFEEVFAQLKADDRLGDLLGKPKWTFFLPLDMALDGGITGRVSVTVLGKKFHFGSWKAAIRRMGKTRFQAAARVVTSLGKVNLGGVCLSVSQEGFGNRDAWEAVDPAFTVLRGSFEFAFGFGRHSLSRPPQARRKLPCPQWFVALSSHGNVEPMRFVIEESGRPPRNFVLKKKELEVTKKIAGLHRDIAPEKSTKALLADCLRLYVQAMDARMPYACLLGFWQLAEALTLSEDFGGDVGKVCARLVWFSSAWRIATEGMLGLLKSIAAKRNAVVHRGVTAAVTDDDVNTLKTVCESGIVWLRGVCRDLPTVENIRQFYQFMTWGNSSLDSLEKVLAYLRKKRKR